MMEITPLGTGSPMGIPTARDPPPLITVGQERSEPTASPPPAARPSWWTADAEYSCGRAAGVGAANLDGCC